MEILKFLHKHAPEEGTVSPQMLPVPGEIVRTGPEFTISNKNTLFPGTIAIKPHAIDITYDRIKNPDIRVLVVSDSRITPLVDNEALRPANSDDLYEKTYKQHDRVTKKIASAAKGVVTVSAPQEPYQLIVKKVSQTGGQDHKITHMDNELVRLFVNPTQPGQTIEQIITERRNTVEDFNGSIPLERLLTHADILFTADQNAQPKFGVNTIIMQEKISVTEGAPFSFTMTKPNNGNETSLQLEVVEPDITEEKRAWYNHTRAAVIVVDGKPFLRNDEDKLIAKVSDRSPVHVVFISNIGRQILAFDIDHTHLTHFEGIEDGKVAVDPSGGGRVRYSYDGKMKQFFQSTETPAANVEASLTTEAHDGTTTVDYEALLKRMTESARDLGIHVNGASQNKATKKVLDPTLHDN